MKESENQKISTLTVLKTDMLQAGANNISEFQDRFKQITGGRITKSEAVSKMLALINVSDINVDDILNLK